MHSEIMDDKGYQARLLKVQREFSRDRTKAMEKLCWREGIPIWWLEQNAPDMAAMAESYEPQMQDEAEKIAIKIARPHRRSGVRFWQPARFGIERASVRDD